MKYDQFHYAVTYLSRLEKTTAIRRIAVQVSSVSRHNGGPTDAPPQYNSALMYGGFHGALNWAPMIPRDASLSDSYMRVIDVLFPDRSHCEFLIYMNLNNNNI